MPKPPPLLLAHSWDEETDVAGWWISEKLDGVRAYWDGKQFLSRLGNVYHAPAWFTEPLPKTPLDGELWISQGQFQRTVSIVRQHDADAEWKQVYYMVFDLPAAKGKFEARQEALIKLLSKNYADHLCYLNQERCHSNDHVIHELGQAEEIGGEGVMLRQPGSRYEVGRSHTLYKVKSEYDEEAVITAHHKGKGRNSQRLGKVTVKTPQGIEFFIGTGFSDAERDNPPPIGTTITYRYRGRTDGGVPRFASFLRVRSDSGL